MLKLNSFARDAALTIAYIGAVSALVAVTVTLFVLTSLGTEFNALHWNVSVLAGLGWLALPFAPRFYRAKTGRGFFETDAFEAQEM